jgi:hypothetical protein
LQIEDDDACYISHNGVVVISQGFAKLRWLALFVCDITYVAFPMVGQGCLQGLEDFANTYNKLH